MRNCIGIDVGGTTIKFGLFREDGHLLEKWEIPTKTEGRKEKLYGDIAASVRQTLVGKGISRVNLAGIGVGIPGPVLPDGKISALVNLGLCDLNLNTELPEYLDGVKVRAVNDANAAALGELWQGGGKDYDSLVLLTLGTGLGCGIVENGRLVAGSFGMGGELGHIIMNPDEPEACNCGGHGCLEQYASATGIARMGRRYLESCDTASVMRGIGELTAKDVLDAAKAGDPLAMEAVESSMRYLGWAMAHVSHMTDPQCFVIGGGVSRAGRYLLDVICRHYESFIHIQKPQAKVCLATLGNDAGIYGAARLILSD
ncbi:MAG: ROK family glucokinase [Lachnospiraceae bacterium]|jgi:glucokinase|nr:ROK family glucokinase [Lachnospiraceae bacterium]